MIYLLYGDEKFELYNFVNKIKKNFDELEVGINFFNINLENINELEDIYETVTFFGGNKLVIIKDTKLKFDVDSLINDSNYDDTYILIEDSIDKRTAEYKKLSKKAEVKEFNHLNENEMVTYLCTMFKRYGYIMNRDVAEYMVDSCGTDKSNNINEMKKIVSFLEKGTNITKEDIDYICVKTFNAKIFDMLDLAVNKKKKEAIILLDELILQKEAIIKIAVMLYKQINQIYMIKSLRKEGSINPNLRLKLHPFVFNKLDKVSNLYSLSKLKEILYRFYDYDSKTKIGDMDFEIGLKQIIMMM